MAYWSRSCKSPERNYSATEREALAAKDGLVRFQPFIEGERVILITDHAALQWARTYENANRRLAAWGAVFAAYMPNLDIVHRAGRAHSNVDPLSRLPRLPPPHDSPVRDASQPIVTDQDRQAAVEDEASRRPAPRLTAAVAEVRQWAEVLEDIPSPWKNHDAETADYLDPRDQVGANAETLQAPAEDDDEPESTRQDSHAWAAEIATEQEFLSEASLLVSVNKDVREAFVRGYQTDPYFRTKWEEAPTSTGLVREFHGQCFFRDDEGLLFFRSEEERVQLCVPKAEVPRVLTGLHDSPNIGAHEGARKLMLRVACRFFWPHIRRDVLAYVASCDVCQKTKHDRRAKA